MVRVGEDDLRARFSEPAGIDPLDGALRADRHEGGCFHVAVRRREQAAARPGGRVDVENFKGECGGCHERPEARVESQEPNNKVPR